MASFSLSSSLVYLRGSTPTQQPQNPNTIIFNFSPKSTIHSSFLSGSSSSSTLGHPFLSTFEERTQNRSNIWKTHAQLNDVVEKSSNSIPTAQNKLEILSSEGKKDDLQKEPVARKAASDPSTISAFMDQVSDLVKLVDSRDIVELQLKQLDCEIIIRKKEALPQPSVAAPVMMQSPSQPIYSSQVPQAPAPAPASANPPSAPVLALPPAPAKSKLSHPPLKCPMAGTFYRSPGPGEPPFVKVGDKVQKGQVVCIIEAMKLMNEIESDQSGTVVEVLAEDGKPVSVDTPLFVIAP